jgi:hypothetical protein
LKRLFSIHGGADRIARASERAFRRNPQEFTVFYQQYLHNPATTLTFSPVAACISAAESRSEWKLFAPIGAIEIRLSV